MKTKAVVFPSCNQIEIRELGLPPVGEREVRTECLYSFVSPGTELRTLGGHYGADKNFPIVPGYASLERIAEVGKEVVKYRVGDLVSSRQGGTFLGAASYWGGEAGGHVFEPDSGMNAPMLLPEDAKENPLKYIVSEVAAISFRGIASTAPRRGERALVIGQGMIGAFAAEFLRIAGANVTVCDINETRLEESRKAGFTCVPLDGANASARLSAYGCGGFDIVAECSGSIPGAKLAFSMLRTAAAFDSMRRTMLDWPRLLLQANYVDDVSLNPCWFFKGEGVILLTPTDRSLDDRQSVVELIRRGEFQTERFTRNVVPPDGMPAAYRRLQNREINSLVCKWTE